MKTLSKILLPILGVIFLASCNKEHDMDGVTPDCDCQTQTTTINVPAGTVLLPDPGEPDDGYDPGDIPPSIPVDETGDGWVDGTNKRYIFGDETQGGSRHKRAHEAFEDAETAFLVSHNGHYPSEYGIRIIMAASYIENEYGENVMSVPTVVYYFEN